MFHFEDEKIYQKLDKQINTFFIEQAPHFTEFHSFSFYIFFTPPLISESAHSLNIPHGQVEQEKQYKFKMGSFWNTETQHYVER